MGAQYTPNPDIIELEKRQDAPEKYQNDEVLLLNANKKKKLNTNNYAETHDLWRNFVN